MNYGARPSYDARKPYSELLIKIIGGFIETSITPDINNWELLLRHYISITGHFMGEKEADSIAELLKELDTLKDPRKQGKSVYSSTSVPKGYFEKAPGLLMKLQTKVITATAHMLCPSQEDDDDEDFDVSQVFGE